MDRSAYTTVVGVFDTHTRAQRAVTELRSVGFTNDQIGVAARHAVTDDEGHVISSDYSGEGAAAGMAAGAGLGALWGMGIVTGVMPVLGPAVAGGALAAILSSAAAGAAVAGLTGALVGMGIPKEDAEWYESEFKAGRVVVTVAAAGREPEARLIIQRNGGYDQSGRSSGAGRTTMDVPVERDDVAREREMQAPTNPPIL